MLQRKIHPIHFSLVLLGVTVSVFFGCGKPQVEKILITPGNATIEIGNSIGFKAVALSKQGEEIPESTFQWSIDKDIGVIDGSGLFTGDKAGKALITASTGGIKGTAQIIVKTATISEKESQPQREETIESLQNAVPPDVVMIDHKEFKVRKKGPVKLNHKKHSEEYGIDCTNCHHDYRNGENVWTETDPVKSCVECHDPEKGQGDVPKLQNAYHRNCRDCHQELIKQGKSETAPSKKCNDCHLN